MSKRHLAKRRLRRAYAKWGGRGQRAARKRVAVACWRRAAEKRLLRRWKVEAATKAGLRARRRMVKARVQKLQLTPRWAAWHARVAAKQKRRAATVKARRRVLQLREGHALRKWHTKLANAKRLLRDSRLERARRVLRRMRLKKRWAEWLERSKGRAGRQSRTLTAWKRVRAMRLAQRFAQWDKALEGRAARRRTRRLGVVNQRNFRLRAGWRAWRRRAGQGRLLWSRALSRIRLLRGWRRWSKKPVASARTRLANTHAHRGALRRGTRRWRAEAARRAALKDRRRLVVTRLRALQFAPRWKHWLERLAAAQRLRSLLNRAARRVRAMRLRRTLLRWWTNPNAAPRARGALLSHGRLRAALKSWRRTASILSSKKEQLRKLFTKAKKRRALIRLFEIYRRREAMRQGLAMDRNSRLQRATDRWCDEAARRKALKDRRRLVAGRLKAMRYVLPWLLWRNFVGDSHERRIRMRRALKNNREGHLKGAYKRWRRWAGQGGGLRRKVAKKSRSLGLRKAWKRWRGQWTLATKLKVHGPHSRKGGLRRGWAALVHSAHKGALAKLRGVKAFKLFRRRALASAFAKYVEALNRRERERLGERRLRRRRLRRGIAAFESWQKRREAVLASRVWRFQNDLRGALRHWRRYGRGARARRARRIVAKEDARLAELKEQLLQMAAQQRGLEERLLREKEEGQKQADDDRMARLRASAEGAFNLQPSEADQAQRLQLEHGWRRYGSSRRGPSASRLRSVANSAATTTSTAAAAAAAAVAAVATTTRRAAAAAAGPAAGCACRSAACSSGCRSSRRRARRRGGSWRSDPRRPTRGSTLWRRRCSS